MPREAVEYLSAGLEGRFAHAQYAVTERSFFLTHTVDVSFYSPVVQVRELMFS